MNLHIISHAVAGSASSIFGPRRFLLGIAGEVAGARPGAHESALNLLRLTDFLCAR